MAKRNEFKQDEYYLSVSQCSGQIEIAQFRKTKGGGIGELFTVFVDDVNAVKLADMIRDCVKDDRA